MFNRMEIVLRNAKFGGYYGDWASVDTPRTKNLYIIITNGRDRMAMRRLPGIENVHTGMTRDVPLWLKMPDKFTALLELAIYPFGEPR